MKIRLAADLQLDSIVDGEGIRAVIWTQGCSHNCPNCHNPGTHDFKGGTLVDIDYIIKEIDELEGHNGITFSGGDPMFQPKQCAIIAKYIKSKGLNVWAYTGFTYEELLNSNNKDILEFLSYIDVLVDGKFDQSKKSFDVPFRGSSNQRLIDVGKSINNHEVCLYLLKGKKSENKKERLFI